jgi:hypothetical protein
VSEFTAICAVSTTLKEILKKNITGSSDAQVRDVSIDLKSPKEMREDGNNTGISLWLYRVTRNGHVLNRAPPRVADDQVLPHPIPVNLQYLVTPMSDNWENVHTLLGQVLQVFNDHSILRGSDLQGTLEGGVEELSLTLDALSLEELTRIWNSLQESYRPSVAYVVQVVTIDSDREPIQIAPVIVKKARSTQILDSA